MTPRPVSSAAQAEGVWPGARVAAAGHVVSHSALLSAGWPGEPNPDPQWLKPHLARLRFKLGEAGAPVPASVRGVGYRLEEAG